MLDHTVESELPARTLPEYEAVSPDERTRRTRLAIAQAAAHAFRTQGYADTTMGSVAVLAGVSPRTLYRHYGNKSALFAAGVAISTTEFLRHLATNVVTMPLRSAIVTALEDSALPPTSEGRDLVRLASTEDQVWGYWLVSAHSLQRPLASILCRAAGRPSSESSQIFWTVRAGALLNAINTAYHHWAQHDDTELLPTMTAAIETVLPILDVNSLTVSPKSEQE